MKTKKRKSRWLIVAAVIAVLGIGGGTVWGIWRATEAAAYTVTKEQALQAAYAHAGVNENEVVTQRVTRDHDDGIYCYEVDFTTDSHHYDYDINGSDGSVIHSSYQSLPGYNDQTAGSSEGSLSEQDAKTIALEDAGVNEADTNYLTVKQEQDDGVVYYDVEFCVNGTAYDYEISVATGQILSCDHDQEGHHYQHHHGTNQTVSSAEVMDYETAKARVLARVEGATDAYLKMELERDNGRDIYEGELYHQGAEYEFEMDALTGDFIKWSVDYED